MTLRKQKNKNKKQKQKKTFYSKPNKMSYASWTEDEEPSVYNNAEYFGYAFNFKYSKHYYSSHLPFLNDLTPAEETKMNKFLHFIDETELKFKKPPEEINDIKEAVHEMVDSFAKHLENTDPLLAVSHKYAVGSMAEGTKIREPDEFDFILVLKELTADNVSVETITKEDIYIKCDDTEFDCFNDHFHKPMPVIQKCTGDVDYQHVHLPFTNLANLDSKNKKFPGKWKKLGYVCNWKNHFLKCLNKDSEGMLGFLNLNVNKSTGTIKNKNLDISEVLINAGPAIKLMLLWESKSGNQLEISVDIVLAIEMNGIENVLAMEEVQCQMYCKILLETNQYFLIPIHTAHTDVCFKVTVTTTELNIMTHLSKEHILCYRILKYLFQGKWTSANLICSYFLKTFLLRHTELCKCQYNPARCLTDILKVLSIALETCTRQPHMFSEYMTVEHLFIPRLEIDSGPPNIRRSISKYLTVNAEQLLEAAKSEHNDQIKDLERLKDAWKTVRDESSVVYKFSGSQITFNFEL
ncbi:uncharacterized protein LOC123532847 [Mercenaria mercenaria]|uniref:uncharacterized protein LOC123532847 n=1 Tax=Mercenaria mercenaria TaxID=6596 RepID=UPI00234E9222|nr:uncharacterized protein LOC123532847 [Mercenaria mercenaria]